MLVHARALGSSVTLPRLAAPAAPAHLLVVLLVVVLLQAQRSRRASTRAFVRQACAMRWRRATYSTEEWAQGFDPRHAYPDRVRVLRSLSRDALLLVVVPNGACTRSERVS